jgi:probable addiction module antidote protein
MKKYRTYREVVIERFKKDPEEAMLYLEVSLEDFAKDNNTGALLSALRTVAEAQGGIPELARRIGMEKMTLYKALSEDGNPKLSTVGMVLQGLGYRMRLEPISPENTPTSEKSTAPEKVTR